MLYAIAMGQIIKVQWNEVRRAAGQSSVHRGKDRVLFIPRIPLSPKSLLTDGCTWRRRDEEDRKTLAFCNSLIFKLSVLCIRQFCHDFDIFVMNGTRLHVTRQYVFCFFFCFPVLIKISCLTTTFRMFTRFTGITLLHSAHVGS